MLAHRIGAFVTALLLSLGLIATAVPAASAAPATPVSQSSAAAPRTSSGHATPTAGHNRGAARWHNARWIRRHPERYRRHLRRMRRMRHLRRMLRLARLRREHQRHRSQVTSSGAATAGSTAIPTGAAGSSVGTPAGTGSTTSNSTGTPAVTWLSGASTTSQSGFGAFRGLPSTVDSIWPANSTWADMDDLNWLPTPTDFNGVLSLGVPMFPTGDSTTSFAACANGDYDSYFAAMGQGLVDRDRGDSFVRLGWEFNGNWYKWSVANTDPATWISCWRHEVGALRSTDPAVRVVWNGNNQSSWNSVRGHMLSYYPGDAWVDVIGVDFYDQWPALKDQATWNQQYDATEPDGAPEGIGAWLAFAEQHGKQLAVPEWATTTTNGGGGDDPFYIKQMFNFFSANASHIAYEAYFDEEADYTISGLFAQTLMPKSAAEYQALWSGKG